MATARADSGHAVLAASFHPFGGTVHTFGLKVDFGPTQSKHFAGAGSRENAEFERERSQCVALAQACDESGDFLVVHRCMMATRQLERLRQQVIQMAAPACRVFALPKALRFGGVQNLFNAAAHSRGCLGFSVQIGFRTARTSSVEIVRRARARAERHRCRASYPLRLVLLVSEASGKGFANLSAISPNVGTPPSRLRFSIGFNPFASVLRASAAFSRAWASGTVIGAAQAHFLGRGTPRKAQYPFAGACLRHDQVEVAAVAVFAGLGG